MTTLKTLLLTASIAALASCACAKKESCGSCAPDAECCKTHSACCSADAASKPKLRF